MGSRAIRTASCAIRSRMEGMPRGRTFPPGFGMNTRRTGFGRNVPSSRDSRSPLRLPSRSSSKALMLIPSHPAVLLPALPATWSWASMSQSSRQIRLNRSSNRWSGCCSALRLRRLCISPISIGTFPYVLDRLPLHRQSRQTAALRSPGLSPGSSLLWRLRLPPKASMAHSSWHPSTGLQRSRLLTPTVWFRRRVPIDPIRALRNPDHPRGNPGPSPEPTRRIPRRVSCALLLIIRSPWSPSPSPVALQASRYDRSGACYVELEGWGYFFP
jgi:hypothetical protein